MMSIGDSNIVLNTIKRPLRLGVVGGAPGSFIGPIHRSAAELDGRFRVVAGALSSDHEKCITHGIAIGLDKNRAYANVEVMIAAEAARSDGISAVSSQAPFSYRYISSWARISALKFP